MCRCLRSRPQQTSLQLQVPMSSSIKKFLISSLLPVLRINRYTPTGLSYSWRSRLSLIRSQGHYLISDSPSLSADQPTPLVPPPAPSRKVLTYSDSIRIVNLSSSKSICTTINSFSNRKLHLSQLTNLNLSRSFLVHFSPNDKFTDARCQVTKL